MSHRIFYCDAPEDMAEMRILLDKNQELIVCDTMHSQLRDLIKLENPEITIDESQLQTLIDSKLQGKSLAEFGVWVYYPWRRTIVHLLPESEFVRVRTIRNAYKISIEEQQRLRSKVIGVVGLSVGQSAALTLIQERICGEIRIADFDTIELSNLNRIRVPIMSIGLKKTTVVAREIAEIDPFIKVVQFEDGITSENLDAFFDKDGRIDLLVEECDSVEIKILLREEAKRRSIPVIMDTSDRGMLDVERYDHESNYPLIHGFIPPNADYDFLKSLRTSEDKLPYIMPILGAETISTGLKASGLEVGKTITTWPQLGSDVVLGGALCANTARRILLDKDIKSGRYFVDLDQLIPERKSLHNKTPDVFEGHLDRAQAAAMVRDLQLTGKFSIPEEDLTLMLNAAIKATSPGNSQRWLWFYEQGNLVLLIDKDREVGFADNFNFGTLVGLGCAMENLRLKALSLGYSCEFDLESTRHHNRIAAIINFQKITSAAPEIDSLVNQIEQRCCNRNSGDYKKLSSAAVSALKSVVDKGDLVRFLFTEDREKITRLSKLICQGDRIRLTNEYGHQDFFKNEIRWSKEESERLGDGLDVSLFNLSELDRLGLVLSRDLDVIRQLNTIGGGRGFERISEKSLNDASGIGVIAIPNYDKIHLINAGRVTERIWLKATELNLGFQPYTVLQMLFSRLYKDDLVYLTESQRLEVVNIKSEFDKIFPEIADYSSVFLFRLNHAGPPAHASARIPLAEKLITK